MPALGQVQCVRDYGFIVLTGGRQVLLQEQFGIALRFPPGRCSMLRRIERFERTKPESRTRSRGTEEITPPHHCLSVFNENRTPTLTNEYPDCQYRHEEAQRGNPPSSCSLVCWDADRRLGRKPDPDPILKERRAVSRHPRTARSPARRHLLATRSSAC